MTELPQDTVQRLACIGLTTPNAAALSEFYERAFGFRALARYHGREWPTASGVSGIARRIALRLGNEVIELCQFTRPGRAYPLDASSSDLRFQHFAIVVGDMLAAYRRLCSVGGWSAISIGGPQRLPLSSGGVEAFKFRDPDGHPLELLAFPGQNIPKYWKVRATGLFFGIDHSAISVSDSLQSIAFYEALGLRSVSRSVNSGTEQACLDGLSAPHVEVTALAPSQSTPHVELLRYRSDRRAAKPDLEDNDVAATRLIFDTAKRSSAANFSNLQSLIDPDGHHLVLVHAIGREDFLNTSLNAVGDPPLVIANPESAE